MRRTLPSAPLAVKCGLVVAIGALSGGHLTGAPPPRTFIVNSAGTTWVVR
jgi:hypothetical protein